MCVPNQAPPQTDPGVNPNTPALRSSSPNSRRISDKKRSESGPQRQEEVLRSEHI